LLRAFLVLSAAAAFAALSQQALTEDGALAGAAGGAGGVIASATFRPHPAMAIAGPVPVLVPNPFRTRGNQRGVDERPDNGAR
jgi:hypothetical protein